MFVFAFPTATFLVLLGDVFRLADACSCVISQKKGVFLQEPRPLLGDFDKVTATLELFLDQQKPVAAKDVIVDLKTGGAEENTDGGIFP